MNKVYYLSETEWRTLVVDTLDYLGYEEISRKNVKELADYIFDMIITANLDGMLVWVSGKLFELWTYEDILSFLKKYYKLK
jgi:hypothetical protein